MSAPNKTTEAGMSEPSPEDFLAFLEQLQQQGQDIEKVPELSELLQQVKKKTGQPTDEVPTEEIVPEPGFVVKTQNEEGRKVFINMCGHEKIAAPGNWAGGRVPEDVQQALDNLDNLSDAQAETLRFPLSMTPARSDTDKKGEPCTTFDCCLNMDVIKQASVYRPLKVFIIELALSWVGHKHKMELDRKFKLPKMRYKGGALEAHRIRVERKPLVREVREVPDDPVFPLVTKKLAPGAAGAPKPAAAAAGAAAGGSAAAGAQAASGAAPPPPTPSPSSSQPVGGGAGEAPAFRQVGPWRVQGRPAQAVSLDVEVPGVVARAVMEAQGPPQELSEGPSTEAPSQARQAAPVSGTAAQDAVLQSIRVDVCGMKVFVGAPGCAELCVSLPFAVKAQGAVVELDALASPLPLLRLTLPYQPLGEYLAQAQAQAPHQFGQVPLASATALELEP